MASSTPAHDLDPSIATLTLSDDDDDGGDDGGDDDDTCPLLDLLQTEFFQKEVLERLDPKDRTLLAQVGRPWLAAVLASGLPRLPKGVLWLRLEEFCTSRERLAWAKVNGCPWGDADVTGDKIRTDRRWATKRATKLGWTGDLGSTNCCALAAKGGHLEALQWARAQEPPCPWSELSARSPRKAVTWRC
jgi:hypothetical protein